MVKNKMKRKNPNIGLPPTEPSSIIRKKGQTLFPSLALPGSVHINSSNIQTGALFLNSALLKNSNNWHAFIIYNNKLKRNDILQLILDYIYPLDLIPVNFEKNGNDCMFLARNCADAIEKICKENLVIPNPHDPNNPIRCEIILQYSNLCILKVDAQRNILNVLSSAFNGATKTLDLSCFHLKRGLSEYSPLSQPKILYFVLHLSNSLQPKCIKLNDNKIKSLFPIEALLSSTTLTSLDLSNNLIDDISQLDILKSLNIEEISFNGNPLCKYFDEHSYVVRIKEIMPKIKVLDGVTLYENGFPNIKKNFLCDDDGYNLVEQFLKHYFTLYDTNRQLLEEMYSPNAMFSLTGQYKTGQNSSASAQLRNYQSCARNLVTLADFSKNQTYLFRGNRVISRKLAELPQCEHDPYSFSSDLMYYNKEDKTAIISVCGAFRENPKNLLDSERLLSFDRTFVLNGNSVDEWTISNEMLHVYNIMSSQESLVFTVPIHREMSILPNPTSQNEKLQLIEALELVANVNKEWSTKLLEDSNYDLKTALNNFVNLYKVDKLPLNAFIR